MTADQQLPRGWVRALWPGEDERIVRHLLRLGPEDLHSRFAGPADESLIRRHVEDVRGRSRVIGWFDAGVLRAAAELVMEPGLAEVALTTEAGYRRHGIAGRLLGRAIHHAALTSARRLVLVTSRSNAAVLRLARGAGAALREEGGEVTAHLDLAAPSLPDIWRDAAEERFGQAASAAAQLLPGPAQLWSTLLPPPP